MTNRILGPALTRRRFGQGALALGVAALILPGNVHAQTPKKGGVLRVATVDSSATDTMDGHLAPSFTDLLRASLVYEKLTEINTDGELIPSLATSWEASDGGRTWTFQLREGVTFHDGKTLDAEDVVYSLNRVRDPALGSASQSLLGDIESIEADGPNTVVVRLSTPVGQLPATMSVRHMVVVPAGATDFNNQSLGTGPFKLEDFQPGLVTTFVRNDDYWGDVPHLDGIESVGIGDESARLNALLSGEVDVIQSVSPRAVRRIEASGVATPLIKPGTAHATFPMRTDMAPFDNPDVRQALSHAFDRQRFIDIAFNGVGTVGRDVPIPETDPDFCEAVPVPGADPELVRSLLEKAGMADHEFELNTSDANYGGANAAVVLGELMRENGVNVRVKKNPADGYWSTVWMKVPWSASSWTSRPTATTLLETQFGTGAAFNDSYYDNEEFTALVAEAKTATDPEERRRVLCEAQMILAADVPSIIPVFVPWADAIGTHVKGLEGHPRQSLGDGQWTGVWLDR